MLQRLRTARDRRGVYRSFLLPAAGAALFLSMAQTGAAQRQRVLLEVPLIKQPYMQCLVASVSMVLKYWGYDITPDAIAQQVPVYKDGTTGRDLAVFIEAIGLRGFLIQPSYADLLDHLEKHRPLVVTIPERGTMRHAMVLVGFDPGDSIVYLNDPATGKCSSQAMRSFRENWERGGRWTFLIVPK
jgi:ABC-type bacteriocin/lantibiotic exporter with double-glycine peptidase domain